MVFLDLIYCSNAKKYNNQCIFVESEWTAGYMPSDLYNLNSAYGSVEELKYCIEEMHNQDLLVCF